MGMNSWVQFYLLTEQTIYAVRGKWMLALKLIAFAEGNYS